MTVSFCLDGNIKTLALILTALARVVPLECNIENISFYYATQTGVSAVLAHSDRVTVIGSLQRAYSKTRIKAKSRL